MTENNSYDNLEEFSLTNDTHDDNSSDSVPKSEITQIHEISVDLNALLENFDKIKCTEPDIVEPNIFNQPYKYAQIANLRTELERPILNDYLNNFEFSIEDDTIMVGSITLEDVQTEERRLREEHIRFQNQEREKARQLREELLLTEKQIKLRIANDFREKRQQLQRQQMLLDQKRRLFLDEFYKSFQRAEKCLQEHLESRKAEVTTLYGDLQEVRGRFGGVGGRRWKVDWNATPQPVQIKVKCLRGLRDKLPAGRYVLVASLYNRAGGDILRWSRLKGQYWGGSTTPMLHKGKFFNIEMRVDQSLFTVLPAKPSVRPGMILCFELFLLRGATVPNDMVVGWAIFPICNGEFEIIEGKYKTPLLRGMMDPSLDKHEKVEAMIASDLDNWLCNLYFELVRLPRYLAGQREYEVELQFSSELLNFPQRINAEEEERDGEIPNMVTEIKVPLNDEDDCSDYEKEKNPSNKKSFSRNGQYANFNSSQLMESDGHLSKEESLSSSSSNYEATAAVVTFAGSRSRLLRANGRNEPLNVLHNLGHEDDARFQPLKGETGVYYKHYQHSYRDEYLNKLNTFLPRTPAIRESKRLSTRVTFSKLQELEQHGYAIKAPFDGQGQPTHEVDKRLNYVRRMFQAELGLSQWRSREFWLMLLMLVLTWFLRMVMHYCAQWLYIQVIGVPINMFNFEPHTVTLNYQPTLLTSLEECLVVFVGPFFNCCIFSLFMLISWISQKTVGSFPNVASKFLLAFGTMTFLDPIWIFIVDAILGRLVELGGLMPIADSSKLYWHFFREEGTGVSGLILTLLIYVVHWTLSLVLLYAYFLRLHNEGRMLDIYHRLHAVEENFFIPFDLELSLFELNFIIRKSEQWRGEEGERRKITVTDYVWEEEMIDNDSEHRNRSRFEPEVTTHVAIHTIHLDGLRELYRHFLRLPSGAILEVFGDINMPTSVPDNLKEALANDTQRMHLVSPDGPQIEAHSLEESKNDLRRREKKSAVGE